MYIVENTSKILTKNILDLQNTFSQPMPWAERIKYKTKFLTEMRRELDVLYWGVNNKTSKSKRISATNPKILLMDDGPGKDAELNKIIREMESDDPDKRRSAEYKYKRFFEMYPLKKLTCKAIASFANNPIRRLCFCGNGMQRRWTGSRWVDTPYSILVVDIDGVKDKETGEHLLKGELQEALAFVKLLMPDILISPSTSGHGFTGITRFFKTEDGQKLSQEEVVRYYKLLNQVFKHVCQAKGWKTNIEIKGVPVIYGKKTDKPKGGEFASLPPSTLDQAHLYFKTTVISPEDINALAAEWIHAELKPVNDVLLPVSDSGYQRTRLNNREKYREPSSPTLSLDQRNMFPAHQAKWKGIGAYLLAHSPLAKKLDRECKELYGRRLRDHDIDACLAIAELIHTIGSSIEALPVINFGKIWDHLHHTLVEKPDFNCFDPKVFARIRNLCTAVGLFHFTENKFKRPCRDKEEKILNKGKACIWGLSQMALDAAKTLAHGMTTIVEYFGTLINTEEDKGLRIGDLLYVKPECIGINYAQVFTRVEIPEVPDEYWAEIGLAG